MIITIHIPLENLTGGMNFIGAKHLIRDKEQSYIHNAIFKNGRWEKRSGYTQPITAAGDGNNIIELAEYQRENGDSYLIAGTIDRIYREEANALTQELNLASSMSATDKWFFAEFQNKLY